MTGGSGGEPQSQFVQWFRAWVEASKPSDAAGRGVMWVVNEAVDPVTGERPLSRAMVAQWMNPDWMPARHLEPATIRTLAALTGHRRDFVMGLVARDIGCADETEQEAWPAWVPPAAGRLSPRARNTLREVIELACRAEGLSG